MKINYRKRLFLYSIGIFTIFTAVIIFFYFYQEDQLKQQGILNTQKTYLHLLNNYMAVNDIRNENIEKLSKLDDIISDKIRITVLDFDGFIIYDNILPSSEWKESKKENIEIKKARLNKNGATSIRLCKFCGKYYMFYAVQNDKNITRIGYLMDEKTDTFFRPNYTFLVSILFLYIVVVIFITYIYNRYILVIKDLKRFVLDCYHDRPSSIKIFTNDEMSEIQNLIIKLNDKIETNLKDKQIERDKLLEHFHYAEEGISFFNASRKNVYTNTHFIQYLNTLFNEPTFNVNQIFEDEVFNEVNRFLDYPGNKKSFNTTIYKSGRYFYIHVIIFEDKSFEIIIRDMTETEKNNFDRAEMTNNIAHELRTPVTSVRGYLETLINNNKMTTEKRLEFINKAYIQINRLTEIIQDMVLLSKTNNSSEKGKLEDVNIKDLIEEIINIEGKENIERTNTTMIVNVKEDVIVKGNKTLLTSIFRNLGNNAIKYAGENITITINNYMEDKEYYYFSFADNGKGIDEIYLTRIFERFYRITEGRTRDKGGSGLGLAIVKDAVEFHHGEIIAKNKKDGGLEFLFTLRKI